MHAAFGPLRNVIFFVLNSADFLELTLQFGMIMMFACAFPLTFLFAVVVSGIYVGFLSTFQSCSSVMHFKLDL